MAGNQSHSIDANPDLDPANESARAEFQEATGIEDELFLNDPRGEEISSPYVNRWEVLVSTTNWEKGRIICDWRAALETDGAPVSAYSDEAWARRVGGVTSQHVGRLRRVFTRFGASCNTFANLSWTHFLAALDWDDAEMWLQGAVESSWSVSNMRESRWETMGQNPSEKPIAADIASVSTDEDFTPLTEEPSAKSVQDTTGEIAEGPRYDGPDFGDEDGEVSAESISNDDDDLPWDSPTAETMPSPFATLPKLPVDVADALEQFKLAVIRHRSSQWEEISQGEMLQAIDALRLFASV